MGISGADDGAPGRSQNGQTHKNTNASINNHDTEKGKQQRKRVREKEETGRTEKTYQLALSLPPPRQPRVLQGLRVAALTAQSSKSLQPHESDIANIT